MQIKINFTMELGQLVFIYFFICIRTRDLSILKYFCRKPLAVSHLIAVLGCPVERGSLHVIISRLSIRRLAAG
jgi:hypothetical protein